MSSLPVKQEITNLISDLIEVDENDYWITLEVCLAVTDVRLNTLRQVISELRAKGLPVYVSFSGRGTHDKAGTCTKEN